MTGGSGIADDGSVRIAMSGQSGRESGITLFLCGDVMTGRGIDQILAHSSAPRLHEHSMASALGYVELAERIHGPIARKVPPAYVWGDALAELERVRPDARIINLETSLTESEEWEPKGINYRMHPGNIDVLFAAKVDACALANNHVLDWGRRGLLDTLEALRSRKIRIAGAGKDAEEARTPVSIPLARARSGGRVLLYSMGTESSGVPAEWEAGPDQPGVDFLPDLSMSSVKRIGERVAAARRPGDVVVLSIHWGGNWGYRIPAEQRDFAHALIDEAQVDLVHGHSSHHAKGIEVYRDKLVLYGCGDFLNDYEGIVGYEEYRGDLSLMYFPRLEPETGRLLSLRVVAMQIRGFQLRRAAAEDVRWLAGSLSREGKGFGTRFRVERDLSLALEWQAGL